MQKGNLPHLARLAEKGVNKTILTCFPSATGPAYLPYLTGCFPGTCNTPGIRWFDKDRYARKGWGWGSFRSYCGLETTLFDRDMNPAVRTAWQIFSSPKSIFNGVTRGIAGKNNLTRGRRVWYYYYGHLTDHWLFVDNAAWQKLRQTIQKRDFDFVFVVYPSVDEFSHRSSPFHPRVRQAYRDIDGFVGKMRIDLETAGILDETLVVLVSDHGLSETKKHFDIGPWLETKKKLCTLYYSDIFKFRFDAVSMVSGNGMAHLYFKGQNGWGGRLSFEELSHRSLLLDELRFRDEIDLVVTQGGDGAIHLQTERGHGSFRYDAGAGLFCYAFDRDDPLGIFHQGDDMLSRGFSSAESLARTFHTDYPDVFVQMQQIFNAPRTGDVIVCARPGFDLRQRFEHPLHKSSHGSISPEHMDVPLISNHRFDAPYIRSVDVFPTVLKLLGKNIPEGIDGESLV